MVVFLILALIAGIILFAFVSAPRTKRRYTRSGGRSQPLTRLSKDDIHARWAIIEGMSAQGGNGLRQALNEADKLFDHVMRQQGLSGDNMGSRLKSARTRFANYDHYDAVWKAHKLRNALAHDVGFDLVPSQAREAIADFHRGLRDMGAL